MEVSPSMNVGRQGEVVVVDEQRCNISDSCIMTAVPDYKSNSDSKCNSNFKRNHNHNRSLTGTKNHKHKACGHCHLISFHSIVEDEEMFCICDLCWKRGYK